MKKSTKIGLGLGCVVAVLGAVILGSDSTNLLLAVSEQAPTFAKVSWR